MKWQLKGVAEGFSRAAGTYDDHASAQELIAERLAGMLPADARDLQVLDLGCGTGFLTARLRERFPYSRIVGVDAAPGMISTARAKAENQGVDFVIGDYSRLCLAAGWDVVTSSCALQWSDCIDKTLAGWYGLLKPGGTLALAMLIEGSFNELETASRSVNGMPFSPLHLPSEKDFSRRLKDYSWESLQMDSFEFRAFFSRPLEALQSFRGLGATFRFQSGYRAMTAGQIRRLLTAYGESSEGSAAITYRALLAVGRKGAAAAETRQRTAD
jgi:malonyl-CoA O-methyltransferase